MKFPTLALLAAAALTAGSCTKRPVRPQFTVVSTDSLISGNGFSCDFEYRFASIANAQDSPALAAIERMNIDRFFDLENFEGTPEGITFYYNPYDIGCYALGSVEVSVSREQLAGL